MNNAAATMIVVALFFAGNAEPQDITITWQVKGKNIGTGYLPKLSSDGIQRRQPFHVSVRLLPH